MTVLAITACIFCQFCLVAGQLFLKRAMNATQEAQARRAKVAANMVGGLLLFALWFFMWLSLLRDWELSRVISFEGLGPPMLMLAAWYFLGEPVSRRAWIGSIVIAVGIALVAQD